MNNNILMSYDENIKVLNEEEIDNLISIVESDYVTPEKANVLYTFCNIYSIIKTLEEYKKEGKDTHKLELLKRVYMDYDKKEFYDTSVNTFKMSLVEVKTRLDNLNEIYDIYKSDKSDYDKAIELSKYYTNPERFRKDYRYLVKAIDDPRFDFVREALFYFDDMYKFYIDIKEKDIIKNVKYLDNINLQLETYEYAKFIGEVYVESENSYLEYEFLNNLGIDKIVFEFCIKTLEELDVDLYKKVVEKRNQNSLKYTEYAVEVFNDIGQAISSGKFKDGTYFNLFEFLKRLPFKEDKNFSNLASNFTAKYNSEYHDIIMHYIYDNNINKYDITNKKYYISELFRTITTINGCVVGPKENKVIVDYLVLNNIPVVMKSYMIARDKYVNGEITPELVEKLRLEKEKKEELSCTMKKTLIPAKRK